MSASQQLQRRAQDLEAQGADALRLDLLRRARRFKRSWIEMAEGLVQLRVNRDYERWGYRDIYAYCAEELLIKRRTVDKLTGSYQAVEQHAPDMLKTDDYEGTIPRLDCVDYFARATGLGGGEGGPAPRWREPDNDVVGQLHQAVFSDGQPLRQIRRQFDGVLFPKSPAETALLAMKRASSAAERLYALLDEIDGLDRARSQQLSGQLEALQSELSALIIAAKDRLGREAA